MTGIIFYLFIIACVVFVILCLLLAYCLCKIAKVSDQIISEKMGENNARQE